MNTWQLQQAKAHFSEVVRQATQSGPQNITVRGEAVVVILSQKDYNKLIKPKLSFSEFIRHSPLLDLKLDTKRDKSFTRDIDL